MDSQDDVPSVEAVLQGNEDAYSTEESQSNFRGHCSKRLMVERCTCRVICGLLCSPIFAGELESPSSQSSYCFWYPSKRLLYATSTGQNAILAVCQEFSKQKMRELINIPGSAPSLWPTILEPI